jgi:hypothetical protein
MSVRIGGGTRDEDRRRTAHDGIRSKNSSCAKVGLARNSVNSKNAPPLSIGLILGSGNMFKERLVGRAGTIQG